MLHDKVGALGHDDVLEGHGLSAAQSCGQCWVPPQSRIPVNTCIVEPVIETKDTTGRVCPESTWLPWAGEGTVVGWMSDSIETASSRKCSE